MSADIERHDFVPGPRADRCADCYCPADHSIHGGSMRTIRTPYGLSNGHTGDGAAMCYAEGYRGAMTKVVKIARAANWSGADFTQYFCDEMNRLGIDLGPDPA